MASSQQLAADVSKRFQPVAAKVTEFDAPLMVIELADQEIAPLDLRPAEEWIGLYLHGLLSFNDPLAVVVRGPGIGQVGRVNRRRLLLHLQEERVKRGRSLGSELVSAP